MQEGYYYGIKLGEIVWGYAYDTETVGETLTLRKEPVKGIILKNESTKPRSFRDDYHFYEVNEKGKIKKSTKVRVTNRRFADTWEEAVIGYNNLVQKQVDLFKRYSEFHNRNFIR